MSKTPLLARAAFSKIPLTDEQVDEIIGADGFGGCQADSPNWSILPTWENNRSDTRQTCTDF